MTKIAKWSPTPHLHSRSSTQQMMYEFTFVLLAVTLYSIGLLWYTGGAGVAIRALDLMLVSLGAAILTETLFFLVTHKFHNRYEWLECIVKSYPFITAILFVMCLPIGTPKLVVAIGSAVSVWIGKLVFGGLGANPFNPALVGRAFVTVAWGSLLTTTLNQGIDVVTQATPLVNLSTYEAIGTYSQLVEPYGGLFSLFIGTYSGAIGETASLAIILGGIYLIIRNIIDWRIPVFYLGTVFVMTWIIGAMNGMTGLWYPMFHLLSGGVLFGAMFMATDLVTSPVSRRGKVLLGLCLGILTVIIRLLGNYPEGVFFSILFMNLLKPVIDRHFMGRMSLAMKRIEIFFWIFMVFLVIGVASLIGLIL